MEQEFHNRLAGYHNWKKVIKSDLVFKKMKYLCCNKTLKRVVIVIKKV
jgi:hypothetical protein